MQIVTKVLKVVHKMPWNYRDYIQLGILICCVPLQLYLSNSKDTNDLNNEVLGVVNYLKSVKESVFSLESWKSAWTHFLSWFVINVLGIQKEVVESESPAIEVLEYRKKHGIHGKYSIVHDTRPDLLRYRVGQVVEHLYEGFKGVIIEWEISSKESEPVYTILLDDNSVISGIIQVEQDQIYLLQNTEITNSLLKNYFVAFDGSQYIPQPWLQKLYPKD